MGAFTAGFECAYVAAGQRVSFQMPVGLYAPFNELRDAMYTPGRGAWCSAEFRTDSDGEFSIDFDYDRGPPLLGVIFEDYLEDLDKYPPRSGVGPLLDAEAGPIVSAAPLALPGPRPRPPRAWGTAFGVSSQATPRTGWVRARSNRYSRLGPWRHGRRPALLGDLP